MHRLKTRTCFYCPPSRRHEGSPLILLCVGIQPQHRTWSAPLLLSPPPNGWYDTVLHHKHKPYCTISTNLYKERPVKSLGPLQCSNDTEILRNSNTLKGISHNQFLNDRGEKTSELESIPEESIPTVYAHWEAISACTFLHSVRWLNLVLRILTVHPTTLSLSATFHNQAFPHCP